MLRLAVCMLSNEQVAVPQNRRKHRLWEKLICCFMCGQSFYIKTLYFLLHIHIMTSVNEQYIKTYFLFVYILYLHLFVVTSKVTFVRGGGDCFVEMRRTKGNLSFQLICWKWPSILSAALISVYMYASLQE